MFRKHNKHSRYAIKHFIRTTTFQINTIFIASEKMLHIINQYPLEIHSII